MATPRDRAAADPDAATRPARYLDHRELLLNVLVTDRDWLAASLVRRGGASPDEARDIIQELAVRVLTRPPHAFQRIDSPRGYLAAMAARLQVDRQRRAYTIPVASVPDMPANDADSARTTDLYALLVELPDRQRQIVVMRFVFDYSTREIAGQLGIAEATVRVHLAKALKNLRLSLS